MSIITGDILLLGCFEIICCLAAAASCLLKFDTTSLLATSNISSSNYCSLLRDSVRQPIVSSFMLLFVLAAHLIGLMAEFISPLSLVLSCKCVSESWVPGDNAPSCLEWPLKDT